MKKILIALALVCVLTGCDGDTKNLSCTQKTDANGLTTKTSYDIEYAGEDVKYLTITYDYSQGNNNDMDGVNADTDGITENNNNARNNTGNNNTTGTTNNTTNNAGDNTRNTTGNNDNTMDNTTGNTTRNNTTGNTSGNSGLKADDIVDGIVGDAIDETIEGVTETILDIAGIRNRYENQLATYDNIEGLTYDVDVDTNNAYRVIYKIDMTKISDNDLARFNATRDLSDLRTTYEGQGYTCK